MNIVRTTMVALTALSVAILPAAGGRAHAFSPETSIIAPSDCCTQGQHCEQRAKGDCAKFAECTLKCSGVSGIPLTPTGVAFSPSASPQAPPTTGIATAQSSHPPSPPPRV